MLPSWTIAIIAIVGIFSLVADGSNWWVNDG